MTECVKITRQGAADRGTQPSWERHTVAPATAGPEDRPSFMLVVTYLIETCGDFSIFMY